MGCQRPLGRTAGRGTRATLTPGGGSFWKASRQSLSNRVNPRDASPTHLQALEVAHQSFSGGRRHRACVHTRVEARSTVTSSQSLWGDYYWLTRGSTNWRSTREPPPSKRPRGEATVNFVATSEDTVARTRNDGRLLRLPIQVAFTSPCGM